MNLYEMTYDTFFFGKRKILFHSRDQDLRYEGMYLLLVKRNCCWKREPIIPTRSAPLVSVSFWGNKVSRFDHLVEHAINIEYLITSRCHVHERQYNHVSNLILAS